MRVNYLILLIQIWNVVHKSTDRAKDQHVDR
ncbi:hypothetical protein EDF88_0597 [Buttiauxella sp. BIGb0552]|nr:hypothetical protein EDF88_0597 [Buttiauxella sp. BIGb0552]